MKETLRIIHNLKINKCINVFIINKITADDWLLKWRSATKNMSTVLASTAPLVKEFSSVIVHEM